MKALFLIMEDARASFHILRLPLPTCHIWFEQSHPPSYAKLLQITTLLYWSGRWRLIIAGNEAAVAGLPTPEKKPTIPPCAKISRTWDTRPYGRPSCPSKKATWTCHQQLHQRRGLHRLPRLGPGTCRRCLRPGKPSIPSWTVA